MALNDILIFYTYVILATKLVAIIASIDTILAAATVTAAAAEEAETILDFLGKLVSISLVSISGGGQPIQTGADNFCFSWATFILRSSNSQKPLPLKKYVLPASKI